MDRYKLTTINLKLFISLTLIFLLLSFCLITAIAYFTQNALLTIMTMGVSVGLFFFLRRYFLNVKETIIEITANGFTINSLIEIKWTEIVWFRHDGQGTLADTIKIKLDNHKVINISYYKKSGEQTDWTSFNKYFLEKVNANRISNYYLSSKWNIIINILVFSYILIPILMYFLKLPLKSTIAPFLIYFGSTSTLIATIYTNRKK
jgi:hypothetical protein